MSMRRTHPSSSPLRPSWYSPFFFLPPLPPRDPDPIITRDETNCNPPQVGSVSIRNTKNILIKNIGDAALGAIFWWLLGYGVAFGDSAGMDIETLV